MLQLQVATELRSIGQSRQQGEEQFHPSVTNITTLVELYNNYSLVTLTHQVKMQLTVCALEICSIMES